MKRPRSARFHALAIGLAVSLPAMAADRVQGRVVDTGLPDPNNGIGGVSIVVTEIPTQKKVGEGITAANGLYEIDVDAPATAGLVASFSKIGYFARPTRQPVKSFSTAQPTVRLSRESAPVDYYRGIAKNIWESTATDPAGTSAYFSAVAALPPQQKMAVLGELKLRNTSAYEDLVAADKTYQSAQEFSRKLRSSGNSVDYQSVEAYPNYGTTGTLWLYGAVPSAGDKRSIEQMAKTIGGVKKVQNDVLVAK